MTDDEFEYVSCRACEESGVSCDGWDMISCCMKYMDDGMEYCDDCDPMDI